MPTAIMCQYIDFDKELTVTACVIGVTYFSKLIIYVGNFS